MRCPRAPPSEEKDPVTSPFRAPFAVYEESTGAGEVRETPRGTGMQKALGELFT